jgi:hypothetical protein
MGKCIRVRLCQVVHEHKDVTVEVPDDFDETTLDLEEIYGSAGVDGWEPSGCIDEGDHEGVRGTSLETPDVILTDDGTYWSYAEFQDGEADQFCEECGDCLDAENMGDDPVICNYCAAEFLKEDEEKEAEEEEDE